MNLKNLLLIALLLISVILINQLTEEGVKRVDQRLSTTPEVAQQDYYLKGFTITSLDQSGEPQHRMRAEEMGHYTGDGVTTLQQPHIELYEQGQMRWQATAISGTVDQQENLFSLSGDVTLKQQGEIEPLSLTTVALTIQPAAGVAQTDQAVTVRQGVNRIDAVGMTIEQQGPQLHLHSQVRGYYELPTP
ncbi:MAG: LPS export ABC transporter periplasmic protein LptC [Chromatiales bacterium]|nr:LPS export ABC transporter periplasmic protein LptC [Chromatiales bacterium]